MTIAFSSTTHTCLYVDDYLSSQSDILYPFSVGESIFVIGDSVHPSLLSQRSNSFVKEEEFPKLTRDSLTSGLVVNSLTVSQGTLDERSISRQYELV